MNKLQVYTDGSCRNNGSYACYAGWSACVFSSKSKKVRVLYGNIPAPSTNNQAEMAGVFYIMSKLKDMDASITIYSDSQYVVKTITEWGHKRNRAGKKGWDGFANGIALKAMYELYHDTNNKAKFTLKWVKGHADSQGNILADEYANYGSDSEDQEVNTETKQVKLVSYADYVAVTGIDLTKQCTIEKGTVKHGIF